ncbi:MAG: hypothetical protein ACXIUD_13915 [Mongoliitalea sp.]
MVTVNSCHKPSPVGFNPRLELEFEIEIIRISKEYTNQLPWILIPGIGRGMEQ